MRGLSKNRKLARHLLDLGWFDFNSKLAYKLKERGHWLSKIERFFSSSKTCHVCKSKIDKLPLGIRVWDCPHCGITHDRDGNATINIDFQVKTEGITVSACGDFNVSRVNIDSQTSLKQEALFIAQA